MKYLKYLKGLGIFFIGIFFIILLSTIFDYFSIISTNITKWVELILISVLILVSSFYIGRKSSNKGYIEGIKYGLLILIVFIFIRLILIKESVTINNIVYYLSIIVLSTVGSVFGINKKSKQ